MWNPIYINQVSWEKPGPNPPAHLSYFRALNIVCKAQAQTSHPGPVLQGLQIFSVVTTGGATGIQRAEVRYAAQHPTIHWAASPPLPRTLPPAPNVNSVETENP